MSEIEQVGPGHWVGPIDHGYQPHFYNTDNATQHYPFGGYVQEDVLQPCNRKVELDYGLTDPDPYVSGLTEERKKIEFMGYVYESASAGRHENFLDMRVFSLLARGGWVFFAFFYGGIYAFCIWLINYLGDEWIDYSSYNQVVFSIFCFIILWGVFRPIPTPVRFHQGNQEVYVWHKGVLYRIPWSECEISVRVDKTHLGYGHLKDGYELVLWLNPKHATNKDLTGQKHRRLVLNNIMGNLHRSCYYYWEYLRRYMDNDPSLFFEVTEKPRRPWLKHKAIFRWGPVSMIWGYILVPLFLLIFSPLKITLLFAPLRRKWPKEVHEWTGKKCDWF